MGFLSLAHEDTSDEIFFPPASGMQQIAPSKMCSCTVRTEVSPEQSPPQFLHTWTLATATIREIEAKEKEKYYILDFGLAQALCSSYTCYFLRSPLGSFSHPSTVSPRLPLQWRHQSHCRFLCCGSLPTANIDQTAVWQHWRQFMLISKRSKNITERIPSWIQQHPAITCHPRGKRQCD